VSILNSADPKEKVNLTFKTSEEWSLTLNRSEPHDEEVFEVQVPDSPARPSLPICVDPKDVPTHKKGTILSPHVAFQLSSK
jgi:uncharacterized ferritin-like protein (DUF455 family)